VLFSCALGHDDVNEFGFDAPDSDIMDTDSVPEHVNCKKRYYAHFMSMLQEQCHGLAEIASRAPSRNDYVTNFHLMLDYLDQAENALAKRDSNGQSESISRGAILDGYVPAAGGSNKRIPSRGEAALSKRRRVVDKSSVSLDMHVSARDLVQA
jgi:hypothetical protein